MVFTRDGSGGVRKGYCLRGTVFQFCKMENFWKCVSQQCDYINTTELDALKWLGRYILLCVFVTQYINTKKSKSLLNFPGILGILISLFHQE